jgi:predicted amidophosphoribosyltransferase
MAKAAKGRRMGPPTCIQRSTEYTHLVKSWECSFCLGDFLMLHAPEFCPCCGEEFAGVVDATTPSPDVSKQATFLQLWAAKSREDKMKFLDDLEAVYVGEQLPEGAKPMTIPGYNEKPAE